jgi:NAD dependent epimerase/dehydratase family enzyme
MLGEMADAMILAGQRVLPAKATRNGFEFRYPDLDSALRQIYQ